MRAAFGRRKESRAKLRPRDEPVLREDIQMRLKFVAAGAVTAAGITLALATAASGEPPAGQVPAHQHYVIAENGELVPVGPNACEDGQSLQFDNFHNNIHRGQPFANGIISASGCPS
jgi:hypothetical protein